MTTCCVDRNVEVFQKRDQTLQFTLKTSAGVPFIMTDPKIYFSVKKEGDDLDAQAVISKANTKAGGSDDQAKLTDGTNGVLEVYIKPDDTKDLDPGDYLYDVVIETAAGKKLQAVEPSRFRILQPITVT